MFTAPSPRAGSSTPRTVVPPRRAPSPESSDPNPTRPSLHLRQPHTQAHSPRTSALPRPWLALAASSSAGSSYGSLAVRPAPPMPVPSHDTRLGARRDGPAHGTSTDRIQIPVCGTRIAPTAPHTTTRSHQVPTRCRPADVPSHESLDRDYLGEFTKNTYPV